MANSLNTPRKAHKDLRLKIAIVGGGGLIGRRHCQHVSSNEACELVAIVDPGPAAATVAAQHGTALYKFVTELLASVHKPEAAIVATVEHYSVSKELAEAGVHILCEKPITNDVRLGEFLIKAVEKHNVKLLIGHHRRFNPYVMAAKKTLERKALGDVTAVNGLWMTAKPPEYFAGEASSWRNQTLAGGGPVLINFVHEIDVLQYLLGSVIWIHAEKMASRRERNHHNKRDVEEGAAIILGFASGVLGTFLICDNLASTHNFEQGTGENPSMPRTGSDVYRIFGTKGTLSIPDMTLSTYGDREPSWQEVMEVTKVEVEDANVAPFDRQLNHFVSVCRGNVEPNCTGAEGLQALRVCRAIHEAFDLWDYKSKTHPGRVVIESSEG